MVGIKALEIAITQLGVVEVPKGSNRGPEVDEYIKSVGLNPTGKYSWCMAFVYWCHEKAALSLGAPNPMLKTGGVMMQYNKRKDTNGNKTPMPGDVFIMDYGKGLGHTGIVESVNTDGTVSTIEGNTNDEGSREGYEVCRRKRPIAKIKTFLRF
jgi:hypothetical protein